MKRFMGHSTVTPVELSLRRTLVQFVIPVYLQFVLNHRNTTTGRYTELRKFCLRSLHFFLCALCVQFLSRNETKAQECDATMFNRNSNASTQKITCII